MWRWCSGTFSLFQMDQPETPEGAMILHEQIETHPFSPCFHQHFFVFCDFEDHLWPLSSYQSPPETTEWRNIIAFLHFHNIKTAELRFSVIAVLTSRPCCYFVITRKPHSFRLMTEKPVASYWNMQAGQANKANPPFPKYKVLLIHWSVTNDFKLIFLTSENGMGLQ